jgi:hypothetical protein
MDRKPLKDHQANSKKISVMSAKESVNILTSEFEKGIALEKCRKCGCMKGALEEMRETLADYPGEDSSSLRERINAWLDRTEDSLYT